MSDSTGRRAPAAASGPVIEELRGWLKAGRDWPSALLEALSIWTTPNETYRRRRFEYFIGGEAFDWVLLAERLFLEVGKLVPMSEREDLLYAGRFPASFPKSSFKDLLGVDKYRGALNFYYGVTVEESLQLAVETEAMKRQASNGVRYKDDFSDEVFTSLYRAKEIELLELFREETGEPAGESTGLSEHKAFTYWLFKRRVYVSDKARVASDTKKGLDQLRSMEAAWRRHGELSDADSVKPEGVRPDLLG